MLPSKFMAIGDVHGDYGALVRAIELSESLAIPPVIAAYSERVSMEMCGTVPPGGSCWYPV